MAITPYKLDGFEHGNNVGNVSGVYDAAVTGTPTIVTSNQRSGSRAMNINPAATTEFISYTATGSVDTIAFYIRWTTLPTVTGAVIARVRNTNGNLIVDWNNTTSQIRIKAGAGAAASGGPTMTTGVYYRVVIEMDASANPHVARCTIDATSEFSSSNAVAALANTDCSLGASSSSTYDAIYDDVVVSATDGDYEQLVAMQSWEILSAIPTSDGTHNITTSGDFDSFTGTAFSNSTTNGNTFIGHRPLQIANTADQVIRQELGTTANYMEVLFENPSNSLVDGVGGVQTYASYVESATTGASLGEIRLMLSDNTVVLTTGSIDVIDSTEDPGTTVTVKKRAAIAPSGGWDETKVDGLKARIGFGDNAPDVNFIDLMIEVMYFQNASAGSAWTGLHTPDRSIYTAV